MEMWRQSEREREREGEGEGEETQQNTCELPLRE